MRWPPWVLLVAACSLPLGLILPGRAPAPVEVLAPGSRVPAEVPAPASTPDYSDHWAGYVASNGPYRTVSATWSQPVLRPHRCRRGALTVWTGLGGYGSSYLAQDGTSLGTPGLRPDQAWWDITPGGMVPVPLEATPGERFTSRVDYLGHGRVYFFMKNDSTGRWWGHTELAGGVDLTTAEAIAERPCLKRCEGRQPQYATLAGFDQVDFSDAQVDGKAIGTYPTYSEHMAGAPSPFALVLANPSPLGADLMSFSVEQDGCG